MTDSKIFEMANKAPEGLFLSQVIGIAEEYDGNDWDAANEKMRELYRVSQFTVREIREAVQMTQKQFSEALLIPKRSIENWEADKRKPPEYVRFYMLTYLKIFNR